jgi:hydrogenase 3 maturation protease
LDKLKEIIKDKTLILGIGNSMKQDDGVGPTVISKLKIKNEKLKMNVKLLDGGMAPENYTGKIKQLKPDTLIIIDAVDFGEEPGSIRMIEEGEIGGQSLSTHNVSLKTFVEFLRNDLPELKVWIIGIQPKQVAYGTELSPEVQRAVDKLCTNLV